MPYSGSANSPLRSATRQQKLATPTSLVVSQMRTARSAAGEPDEQLRHSGSLIVAGSTVRRARASPESRQSVEASRSTTSQSPWQIASSRWLPEASPLELAWKQPLPGGQRQRVVRADQLVRHPDRSAADEIAALDPEDRQARLEPVAVAGKPVRVGDPVLDAHLPVARQLQRFRDVLGVPELGRFHDTRRLGRREGQPLALRDGDRPGVGSTTIITGMPTRSRPVHVRRCG